MLRQDILHGVRVGTDTNSQLTNGEIRLAVGEVNDLLPNLKHGASLTLLFQPVDAPPQRLEFDLQIVEALRRGGLERFKLDRCRSKFER